jgi:hypothetical protein
MRKVTMVVLVLITSCQLSLNPKIGPVIAQITMTATAIPKVLGCPAVREVNLAKWLKEFAMLIVDPR